MPAEPSIAAAIAVPVALLGDLSPEAAIAVAVPVGLLGSYLYRFRFSSILFLGKYTDKAVEDLNTKLWPDRLFFIHPVCLIFYYSFRLFSLGFIFRGTIDC